jgi:hypothetical protein
MSNSYPDFLHLTYLRSGTARQQLVYAMLEKSRLMERLAPYGPVLAGTIPIDIDVETSDVDILCRYQGPAEDFAAKLSLLFTDLGEEVVYLRKTKQGMQSVICRFTSHKIPVEVFAQPVPATQQHGYLHMIAEYRLLALSETMNPRAHVREEIRKIKRAGEKTEPAFAKYFKIEGDAYEKLRDLAAVSDEELREIVTARDHTSS